MSIIICIYAIKFIIALSFIMAGAICLGPDQCTVSDPIASGFLGAGIGIIFSGILSIFIYNMEMKSDKCNVSNPIVLFVCTKITISLVLLIVGISILNTKVLVAGGLIGASISMIICSFVSLTLFGMCLSGCAPR